MSVLFLAMGAAMSTDDRPLVPYQGTSAEGAEYNERLQELVSDTREALSKKTKRVYSDYTAVQFLKNNKNYWVGELTRKPSCPECMTTRPSPCYR